MSDYFWNINKNTGDETGEKHSPVITVTDIGNDKLEVTVDVGSESHPTTNGHHIQWVELQGNGMYLARAEFAPVISQSVAKFIINKPGQKFELSALSRCNLHGVWKSEKVMVE